MDPIRAQKILHEVLMKEFIRAILHSAFWATGIKLLFKNLPWLLIFVLILFIIYVCLYVKRNMEILNTYKALDTYTNWDFAYSEKLILKLLIEKDIKTFLLNDNFTQIINKEFLDIDEFDLDQEELSVLYEAKKQFNNKEHLNCIIENLIAREFIKPINKKGLLSINNKIYKYVLKEKQKKQREMAKRENECKKNLARLKKQQLQKQRPTITRRINLFFVDKFRPLLKISNLKHTWLLDIDGTLVKHNGYKIDGYDTLLDGVKEFFETLSPDDKVVLLTARKEEFLPALKDFLAQNNIRYDFLLTDMPMGERILVNDRKPSGLDMSFAINKNRDDVFNVAYKINEEL